MLRTMLRMLRSTREHPLAGEQVPQAVLRFLRWQLSNRLLPVPYVMPYVEENVFVMERGMTDATGNWYFGLHEFYDMTFVLHVLLKNDLIADIGANVGSYTVLASGVVGARTISFEPVPDTFRKLTRNVVINEIDHLVAGHNIGLSARAEILRFTSCRDTVNHAVVDGSAEATTGVPVKRLDDVLAGEAPLLIKSDVEGWEAEVLDGMPRTLADPRFLAIITETTQSSGRYDRAGTDRAGETMRAHGFTAHTYDPFKRTLSDRGSSHNTIFARNLDAVRARLTTAPRPQVLDRNF